MEEGSRALWKHECLAGASVLQWWVESYSAGPRFQNCDMGQSIRETSQQNALECVSAKNVLECVSGKCVSAKCVSGKCVRMR